MNKIEDSNIFSPSFGARFAQFIMGLIQMKKSVEKNMIENSFPKEPALMPKSFFKKYIVEENEKKNRKIWTISSKNNNSEVAILYLHGGAYVANITKQHWLFIEKLLEKTKATIIVPDYPLSPEFHCKDVYDFILDLYSKMLIKYSTKRVIFIGDSAGGGIALGFSQYLRNQNRKQPEQIILISPWLDVTMSNPDLKQIEVKDKILSVRGLKSAGEKYAGDLDLKDYRVSPIYGDFKGLCNISIFTGTHDILNIDAKKCKQLMEKSNIQFNYFEYPKMFHDWIVIPNLKETRDVINKVYKLINNYDSEINARK